MIGCPLRRELTLFRITPGRSDLLRMFRLAPFDGMYYISYISLIDVFLNSVYSKLFSFILANITKNIRQYKGHFVVL